MLLRTAPAESSIAHATIWNFLRKELGRFPYKLHKIQLERIMLVNRISNSRNEACASEQIQTKIIKITSR